MRYLITGASRGIGHGLALNLAAAGHAVTATHRGAAPAPAEGIDWQPLDVADPASHEALAARLAGRPLDGLVCNAGVYPDKGLALAELTAEHWARGFAVNVTGVFLSVQALLPNLRAGTRPRIAIIASAMGSNARAPGGSLVYRASKAAAINLGRNLARDLAPEGIAVGIYHPGWVRTDMGGTRASIGVDEAVAGLAARLDALGPDTSGAFLSHDGTPLEV
ncbi:MAG: SDR family NAD(P)-dependent oxidoreductase [Rhodobacteraceae bacterium]|nr:SDR family NAD(P)-dependent oxidoreductase [Paracoccaceae bacterium]